LGSGFFLKRSLECVRFLWSHHKCCYLLKQRDDVLFVDFKLQLQVTDGT